MSSNVERAAEVLLEHQRTWSGKCMCGWGYWGASFSRHQAQMLTEAKVLLPDGAEVTTEWAHLTKHNTIKTWPTEGHARERAAILDRPVLRRTFIATEWQEVADDAA